MFGAFGRALGASCVTFVSQAAVSKGVGKGLNRQVVPVFGIREIGKAQMVHNDACPRIEVDPETYQVRADGELLTCEPAKELAMAQRYFLY
jgi:urease subunit alpha